MAAFTPKHIIVLIFVLLAIGAGAAGTFLADRLYFQPLREQQLLVANLKELVERLAKTERLAEVVVLERTENPLRTRFRFDEVAEDGARLDRKEFTVEGDEVYFDALVIKFDDHLRELKDLPLPQKDIASQLVKKSLILFRRVFGSKQKPEDGFPLDVPGSAPGPYKAKAPASAFEAQLWREFWNIANDPQLAKSYDVRVAHGEAPFIKLLPNRIYVLQQRLSGGLEIKVEQVRSVLQP